MLPLQTQVVCETCAAKTPMLMLYRPLTRSWRARDEDWVMMSLFVGAHRGPFLVTSKYGFRRAGRL